MPQDFFHSNLRRARERAGLSQSELAEEIGIGRTTVVSLESGKTRSRRTDETLPVHGVALPLCLLKQLRYLLHRELKPAMIWLKH